ncbi:hypothethical protein (plasmid) [Ralstonia solanacearum PSI07]|uniref:Hypothethical protein n=1 Tax=blood disease bacterium R229 TaxID=741978 RepID=G2ZRU4_9RALS|nr:hypothethical protein [Ralstonia solanacearum PSI07]CCA81725.1 hypothethical protein [blood disease bacterium R229]
MNLKRHTLPDGKVLCGADVSARQAWLPGKPGLQGHAES